VPSDFGFWGVGRGAGCRGWRAGVVGVVGAQVQRRCPQQVVAGGGGAAVQQGWRHALAQGGQCGQHPALVHGGGGGARLQTGDGAGGSGAMLLFAHGRTAGAGRPERTPLHATHLYTDQAPMLGVVACAIRRCARSKE
jgi:hypothetical protein